ncbi:MAG: hypothetical protein MO846_06375 [Candidatus Devosia symbiotica]|nr:hypothetical protein [Candidatus Devosia symbiotica]
MLAGAHLNALLVRHIEKDVKIAQICDRRTNLIIIEAADVLVEEVRAFVAKEDPEALRLGRPNHADSQRQRYKQNACISFYDHLLGAPTGAPQLPKLNWKPKSPPVKPPSLKSPR